MPLKRSTKRNASATVEMGNRNKKPKINVETSDSEGLHFISVLFDSICKRALSNVVCIELIQENM